MDIKNLLISKAKEIGVKVSPAQAEQFQIYLDLLLERNTVMNLTAITDPEEAVIKHFVDSLTLLKALEIKKNAKVIDVGTGAGFPGIPLKIMRPDIELTLLDSLNKRLVFLREVCDAIGIEAETIHKRAEEAGKDTKLRESFDVATARAVANMNILAEYCIPLIKMKGYFAAMKGPSLPDELEYARKAISSLGCDVVKTVPFILPDEEQSERFVIYRKAELSDIPKLNPLLAQLSDAMADPQKMAEKMKKIAKNEDNYLLVAENTENGDLCGSLIGVVFEDICDTCKPILLVENVVTDEKYRGKGIGRGMFEAIETWGREKECHYCILVSGLQRTGAHKFYDAIGYSEVKGFKKYL